MFKRIALSFATVALAVVSAASTHRVTFFETAIVGGQELKAGEYKLALQDNKAIITSGKQSVEAAVRIENGADKYRSTAVRYDNSNGQMKVQEIRIGGTNTKLVFGERTASLR